MDKCQGCGEHIDDCVCPISEEETHPTIEFVQTIWGTFPLGDFEHVAA